MGEITDIRLWQGDCLDLMNNVEDKSIDLILCDLPYGSTKNKWDSAIPLDQYVEVDDLNMVIASKIIFV